MLSLYRQQVFLRTYGYYYTYKIDGIKGRLHTQGIASYQKAKGITSDTIWGVATDWKAYIDALNLQIMLNMNGADITEDGIIGQATIKAIEVFQKAHHLVVDGIVGPATKNELIRCTWNQIRYFKRAEFACEDNCGGFPVEMNMHLIKLLDQMRAYFGVPITITSGVRCEKFNAKIGGISNSEHRNGKAADIYVPGVSKEKIKQYALKHGAKYSYYGTAQMGNAVHINV